MPPSAPSRSASQPDGIGPVPTLLKLVCELTGMDLALVARVEDERWMVCAVHDRMSYGLAVGDQLEMDALQETESSAASERFGSRISIPVLHPDGQIFGILCALDRKTVPQKPDLNASLQVLAELLELQLRAENEHRACEEQLKSERETGRAREEFIAVLGHDLRNPLSSLLGAADFLEVLERGPDRDEMFRIIRNCGNQIRDLIEDVLDFARGRLSAGIPLDRRTRVDLAILASEAIDEACAANPGRSVHLRRSGPLPASIDAVRVRQLLSNLLGNALQHSPPAEPVTIKLDQMGKMARIAITNGGPPLSEKNLSGLFSPFAVRPNRSPRAGLGLGLFIASEIARAHGGGLKASSSKKGTTLTTLLPREIME